MRPFGRNRACYRGQARVEVIVVIAAAGHLLPAPFADWLEREVAKHPYNPKRPEHSGAPLVASRLGVSTRAVTKVLKGDAHHGESGIPTVEHVDRFVTRLGGSIRQLYGDLFELPLSEPDWKGGECPGCGEHMRRPAPLCGFCEAGI